MAVLPKTPVSQPPVRGREWRNCSTKPTVPAPAGSRLLADLVTGAAESLDGRRNGPRRLDEDDGVEGADVDAHLERGRADEEVGCARPSPLFDLLLHPLLTHLTATNQPHHQSILKPTNLATNQPKMLHVSMENHRCCSPC